jgi:integrase
MSDRTGPARCWHVDTWPALDRNAWILGLTPGDPFDDNPRYGASLRTASQGKIRRGYGRWLDFLAAQAWLDPLQPPLARVTRARLRAYFGALRAAGNADYTLIGRFSELEAAMKIMAPGQPTAWIRRPKGPTIYATLRKTKRALLVPDAGVLYDWALSIMEAAGWASTARAVLIDWRDGLLLAMFAARARRLRPMAALRIGDELVQREDCYRIDLPAHLVKTGTPDRFDLPTQLTPYIRHYLDVIRPALLQGRQHDALWISHRGDPLTAKAIQHQVTRRTRARFGTGFGPHRFRHAIGTTAPMRDPDHPGVGAELLGISREVLEQHYNRAGQSRAARMMDQTLRRRRARLAQARRVIPAAVARGNGAPARP